MRVVMSGAPGVTAAQVAAAAAAAVGGRACQVFDQDAAVTFVLTDLPGRSDGERVTRTLAELLAILPAGGTLQLHAAPRACRWRAWLSRPVWPAGVRADRRAGA